MAFNSVHWPPTESAVLCLRFFSLTSFGRSWPSAQSRLKNSQSTIFMTLREGGRGGSGGREGGREGRGRVGELVVTTLRLYSYPTSCTCSSYNDGSTLLMSVSLYVCVSWGYLDVWGELAIATLTNRPSSQGWASRCPLLYIFVCLSHGWVGYLFIFHTLVC